MGDFYMEGGCTLHQYSHKSSQQQNLQGKNIISTKRLVRYFCTQRHTHPITFKQGIIKFLENEQFIFFQSSFFPFICSVPIKIFNFSI